MFLSHLFASRKKKSREESFDFDAPMVQLSKSDHLTAGNLLEGVAIIGGPGSGKTTTSGHAISKAMLSLRSKDDARKFSGLILTVKPEEANRWGWICREAGRSGDLIIFDGSGTHRFNFLAHEAERKAEGAGLTENILTLFDDLSAVQDRATGQASARQDEAFWQHGTRRLSRRAVDLLKASVGTLSVPYMIEILRDASASPEAMRSADWQSNSILALALARGEATTKTEAERHDFEQARQFFQQEWPFLAEKTKTIFLAKLLGILDPLASGLLHQLFSTSTTITPEDVIEHGKILVIDLPVKKFGTVGLMAQTLWKHEFQKAIERRTPTRGSFIYIDEAQALLTARDQQFAATARSARCANIWLTQCLSNVHAALGGDETGKAVAESLMALSQTKIFHAQPDPITNEWAANLLGRRKQRFGSMNCSHQTEKDPLWGEWNRPIVSTGFHQSFEHALQPHEFARLAKPTASYRAAQAIVFQGGRIFKASGETYLKTSFKQGF